MELSELQSDIRYNVFGDRTNEQYADTDINRNINKRYRRGVAIMIRNKAGMQLTGDDIVQANISSATQYITLDTDILSIKRVDIKYPSDGQYRQATRIEMTKPQNVGLDKYSVGVPEFALFAGRLYYFVSDERANISAVTNGIQYYFHHDITDLSGDTDTPLLTPLFHDYITVGATLDYHALPTNKVNRFTRELMKIEDEMNKFYAVQDDTNRSLTFRREDYGQRQVSNFKY